MTVLEKARATTSTIIGQRRSSAVVQWNETLDAVLARMDAMAEDEALVLQGDQLIGRIARLDIELLKERGNWPGSIRAVDAMSRKVA